MKPNQKKNKTYTSNHKTITVVEDPDVTRMVADLHLRDKWNNNKIIE